MLTPMEIIRDNILAFTASGKVTDEDYKKILGPAMEAAAKQHGDVRVLMHFGPAFEGYTAHAAFDDAMLGMKNFKAFKRVAVVTDNPWFLQGVKFSSHLLPFEMRAFAESEMEEAKQWIGE